MKKLYFLMLLVSVMANSQVVAVQQVATGFNSPVDIANCGDDRLFIVQQTGQIRILNANGTINPTNFLNISSLISTGGERGLLGMAFHPNYATNGHYFVNYTNTSGNTVIARYTRDPNNINQTLSGSAQIVITISQPYSNHNGGTLKFGPDGNLWIGMGDGGSGGDPENRAQNINTLLGKMVRINVDELPYTIPDGNMFIGVNGSDEIYSTGLRNPWKFSFDFETGHLWTADVGQQNVEEINKELYTATGLNYGWRCYEGNSAYNTAGCPNQNTLTFPEAFYPNSGNECSITGGYVYRGTEYPNFVGLYFFADYCSGRIGTVNSAGTLTWRTTGNSNFYTTFGEGADKTLYIAGDGKVFKVVDTSLSVNEVSDLELKIFPNPATNFINISASELAFPAKLNVFDLNGKQMLSQTIDSQNSIDVSRFASGLYVAQLTLANGQQSAMKFTKK